MISFIIKANFEGVGAALIRSPRRNTLIHPRRNASVQHASTTHSPILNQSAGITNAVDRRALQSGALPIHAYSENGSSNAVNQVLFDGFVKTGENTLSLTLSTHEIDNSVKYNIEETQNEKIDDLGTDVVEIPLQNSIHSISSGAWSGEVRVEVFAY